MDADEWKYSEVKEFKDFDFIIDVRTPLEYEHSHIPESLNLPVFSDEEYAQIGTIYKQESPLKAKIIGAAKICNNISKLLQSLPKDTNLQNILNHKNRLLIYCARGGNRSEAMCIILNQIGFRVQKLKDGYKGYRNKVVDCFNTPLNHFFITLCGPSGCGKSEIIQNQNNWSIDLESLAKHYGSSFGNAALTAQAKQPTQKMFENMLFEELSKKANEYILLIEAESRKLGQLIIPNSLFKAYHHQVMVLVQADMEARIQRTFEMYKNISQANFLQGMQKIKLYISKNIFYEIQTLWDKKDLKKIAEILLEKYYDKVYKIPKYSHTITNKTINTSVEEILEIKKFYQQQFKN